MMSGLLSILELTEIQTSLFGVLLCLMDTTSSTGVSCSPKECCSRGDKPGSDTVIISIAYITGK